MNTRRILGILLAVALLLTLFSACANDTPEDPTGTDDDGANVVDDTTKDKDKVEDDDDPVETETATLSFLSYEAHGTYTLDTFKDYTTYKNMEQHLLDNYGVIVDLTLVNDTAYVSTLNSYTAAQRLTDIFYSGRLADDTVNNSVAQGLYANMEDVLVHSDGTASGMFEDGATFNFIKGMNIREDGNWYTCHTAASSYTNINLDRSDKDYICAFPLTTFYNVQIRYDWLQKLGLSVPSTTQEYLDALVAFQENDVNGNTIKDERAYLCLGTPNESNSVYVGIGGWFGLTNGNFVFSIEDGSIQSAIMQDDRYIAFANYMGELYDAGVVLNGEGSMWNRNSEVATNHVSSYQQYPNNTHNGTVTGDPDSLYYPTSVIQAIEGVTPTIQGQADVVGYTAYAFNANSDLAACARWMDFIHSEYFFEMLQFGVEGKSFEWNDDGSVNLFALTEDEAKDYRGMWTYMTWTVFPQIDTSIVYHYNARNYNSISEAVDNGEPYRAGGFASYEEYLERYPDRNFTEEGANLFCFFKDVLEYGEENIDWTCAATFRAAHTNEELEVISLRGSDIRTYFDELNINYIMGMKSTDTYEEDIQYAYDNLYLQEYIDCLQAASNRYLVAVGRDPIL